MKEYFEKYTIRLNVVIYFGLMKECIAFMKRTFLAKSSSENIWRDIVNENQTGYSFSNNPVIFYFIS